MINENYNNGEDYICNIVNTMNPINTEVLDKEYILQHTKYGWRCISHHPHYIMTEWVKIKDHALLDGDDAIEKFYSKMKKAGEALRIVYERMMKEKDNKNG